MFCTYYLPPGLFKLSCGNFLRRKKILSFQVDCQATEGRDSFKDNSGHKDAEILGTKYIVLKSKLC